MLFEEIMLVSGLMGAMVMFAVVIVAMAQSKKKFPILYICIEDRNGNRKIKLRKGFVIHDKKTNVKNFALRKTVFDHGIGAIFDKDVILTQVPERMFLMVKETGGDAILTYSPAENVYMPLELVQDNDIARMIIQDTEWRNWFKVNAEKMLTATVLNPKTNWQEKAPLLIIGAVIMCIVLITIYGSLIIPFLTSQNAQLASSVANVISAFENAGTSVGQSISGVNVIT